MSYSALYRKYRPKVFEDVIGQEHIILTLTNQVKNSRISHAYLFTGSRGTGKTTCAKIFAKAVNCLKNNNGSPCGKCEVCRAMDEASNIDIMEIDAASNNKVDEVREIREQVKYPPVKGKYKTYIIDEVHMLTDSAFNALLKTLEEPPPYVIFILATTEVHKIPATILSRCLRFDFRLVSIDKITELLVSVFKKEKKIFEEEALRYIAEAAEGSVRDALSIADTALNFSKDTLKLSDVLSVLGAADKSKICALFEAVATGDTGAALLKINELSSLGKSMQLIAKELTKYARDLLVLKTTGETLIIDTKENIAKMNETQKKYSADLLISVIQTFSAIDADLRYSVSPKIVLETTAIRVCRQNTVDLSSILERLRRLEENGAPSITQNVKTAENPVQNTPPVSAVTNERKPMDAKSVWGRCATYFRNKGAMRLYTLVGSHSDVDINGNNLIIYAQDERFLQFTDSGIAESIDEALSADGNILKCKIVKKAESVDMDKEINNIKKLMGKAKVNIIK